MPINFLSDEQAAAYSSFGDKLSVGALHRFFFLDDKDRELIARRRRDANRLGYAVQLCAVRAWGRFLPAPAEVPTEALSYLATQLGISDSTTLAQYARRAETHREHTAEIQRLYQYRDFAQARAELASWVTSRSWNRGEGPTALFEASWRWLRDERVLLPGVTSLTRVVATARQQATDRMWQVLAAIPSPIACAQLEELLEVEDRSRVSTLERLRVGPRRISGTQMRLALERIREIERLGFVGLDTSEVPPRRVLALARYGLAGKVSLLKRHPPDRRIATLVATVTSLLVQATDEALDLFDALLTTKLLSKAKRDSDGERLRRFSPLATASSRLARAVDILLSCIAMDPEEPLRLAWKKIEKAVDREALEAAIGRVEQLTPTAGSDLDELWRSELDPIQ